MPTKRTLKYCYNCGTAHVLDNCPRCGSMTHTEEPNRRTR